MKLLDLDLKELLDLEITDLEDVFFRIGLLYRKYLCKKDSDVHEKLIKLEVMLNAFHCGFDSLMKEQSKEKTVVQ